MNTHLRDPGFNVVQTLDLIICFLKVTYDGNLHNGT